MKNTLLVSSKLWTFVTMSSIWQRGRIYLLTLIIYRDILRVEDLESVLRQFKPDVVIHTAGIVPPLIERYHRRIENEVQQVNVEGTRNVLNATRIAGIGAFVLRQRKLFLRLIPLLSQHVSFDHQLIPPIHACIAKGETPFIIGSADNLWDITYVSNVADAHVLAAENLLLSTPTAAGKIIFIQNNTPITFRDFSLAIWKEFGHIPPYEVTIPDGLAWLAGLLAEVASWLTGSREHTLSRGSANDACAVRYASGEKAKRILGYEARVDLEEGIRLSCEEYKRRLEIREKQE
ncbi:putative NAD dependent epimerase/dehydratase [Sclerotinia borealis F-4128]|uniref:Putative NAD dependent epimerase/dehydratase n=1 Tax=Sclerotinia borealis (strain F-4128) TaxID=1432307 RepID=W9C1W3_SCLBF|nr:putative NAD dependent epimerase/dehydratase [Sclerotinia borealis F-4128]